MSEELKPTISRPDTPFTNRLPKMSWSNLKGETKRLGRQASKTKNLEDSILADVLLNVFFKSHDRGNDPYCLEHNVKGPKFFEIKSSGKRSKA